MNTEISESLEGPRGCGYRDKPGALYMMSGPVSGSCGKLPHDLEICSACGGGIKPSPGWTWINIGELLGDKKCFKHTGEFEAECKQCPLRNPMGRISGRPLPGVAKGVDYPDTPGECGLLWIGGKFYKDPASFLNEAAVMGISRRISAVPKGFVMGETYVALAHREAVWKQKDTYYLGAVPGIFAMFQPIRIDVICNRTESDETINAYHARGLTPVHVTKVDEQFEIPEIGAAT